MKDARRGQVLVESLVAVSLLVVGFLGMFSLLNRSLSLNRVVSDSYIATYLASEGVEVARNIIDANVIQRQPWKSGGFASPGSYEVDYTSKSLTPDQKRFLSFDPASGAYGYSGGVATRFRRTIIISPSGHNEVEMQSIVSWTTLGGGSYQVNLEDHFMNWRS